MYTEKSYLKTDKLKASKFRGQKALVVEALADCTGPVTLKVLIPLVDRNGRYITLLNAWARENGGVRGSILFHLRALKRLGMVKENGYAAVSRTQVVGWGNSRAVRIPKAILDEAQIREGDEVEVRVENGCIALTPVNPKVTLESLVAGITPENRHEEVDWGKPVGREVW
jgi:antitoxin MazE